MRAIVAVSNNWGIGKNNKLLFHIKDDMDRFKELTMGHVVVMGRKTFESFPFKKPLAKRVNIILTHDKNYNVDSKDVIIVNTMEELKDLISMYPPEEVYLIGGDSLYNELIDYCSTAYVTYIDKEVQDADAFFPNLHKKKNWWMMIDTFPNYRHDEKTGLNYRFATYINDNVKPLEQIKE